MIKLTKRMKEVFQAADLERGEINDVPLSTAYGLEDRGLISSQWRRTGVCTTTEGGNFPRYGSVKLTSLGLQTASAIIEQDNYERA